MSGRRAGLRWPLLAALLWGVAIVPPLAAHENTVVHRGLAHWSVDVLGDPFYTPTFRTEVGNGSDNEDVPATRSLGHFYNPETDSAPFFAFGSGPATTNSQDQYDAAISAYLANSLVGTDAAFHRMGRALHFIQDMTSPAHTHDDDHATGDDFEGWGPDNFGAMDFSTVTPKIASPPTAAGFVREIGQLVYDQTVYQAVLHESAAAQPASTFKQMFPSLHFETGGFFVDDHFEIDRIGDWGCDLLCADDWWIPDELLTTDNGGPGGVVRHTGSAYVENTGGDGGAVIPVVFDGQPNLANESLLQLYARHFYPEAIAYGAGLLQVFAAAVGPPAPTPTGTQTRTATNTATPTASATSTATRTASNTATATPPATATNTPTPAATATATFTAAPSGTPTHTATATLTPSQTRTSTLTRTPTSTASATPTQTASTSPSPSATPTPTTATLCAATPRSGCITPSAARRSKFQLRDSSLDSSDSAFWRWSGGDATLAELGDPSAATDYALCAYDREAGVASLAYVVKVSGGGTCFGQPCWKALSRGFRYKSRDTNPDGVQSLLLKTGTGGKAKLLLKAKGLAVALPAPASSLEMLHQSPMVTVQLVNSVGSCWQANYSVPAQRNQPAQFNDKSD